MLPSDPAAHETSPTTQVSTPASFLSGAKDLPSPASSQGLFERLAVVAHFNSDPWDLDFSFSSPNVERISGVAGKIALRNSCSMSFHFFIWIQMFNLVSLNINSLNDLIKRTALIDWVKCLKAAGTAILVKHTFKITKIIKDDAGRFVQAFVNFGEDQLSFVSLYAPNKNPERNTFLLSLADLIDLSHPVFIAGDFNSVLDPLLDQKRRPSFVDRPSSRFQESGVALQSLLQQTQTYPLWRELHPGRIAYSLSHGSGTFASRIDMILGSSQYG